MILLLLNDKAYSQLFRRLKQSSQQPSPLVYLICRSVTDSTHSWPSLCNSGPPFAIPGRLLKMHHLDNLLNAIISQLQTPLVGYLVVKTHVCP